MMRAMIGMVGLALLGGCGSEPDDPSVYILYRSPIAGSEIIHVATFDAAHGADYNEENCNIVAGLMQSQPGVTVSYWCRMGRPDR